MQGKILGYDAASHTGAISGHDGKRYKFVFAEWKSPGTPQKGAVVDFVADGDNATEIYLVESAVAREGWLSFLFSSDGRVPRKRYWLSYVVPVTAISIFLIPALFYIVERLGAQELVVSAVSAKPIPEGGV